MTASENSSAQLHHEQEPALSVEEDEHQLENNFTSFSGIQLQSDIPFSLHLINSVADLFLDPNTRLFDRRSHFPQMKSQKYQHLAQPTGSLQKNHFNSTIFHS